MNWHKCYVKKWISSTMSKHYSEYTNIDNRGIISTCYEATHCEI